MHKNQQNRKDLNNQNINYIAIKAKVNVEYYAISKEALEQIEESSNSTAFNLSLFFFSLSIGIFVTLATNSIKNYPIFLSLIILASFMFVIGIFKFLSHRNSRKQISEVLKKVKKQKCSVT